MAVVAATSSSSSPVVDFLLSCPLTSVLVVVLCGVCYFLNDRWVEAERVGFSYLRVVQYREWWRAASGAFSHYSLAHLVFNGAALYSVGLQLEPVLGTVIRAGPRALSYAELNAGVCRGRDLDITTPPPPTPPYTHLLWCRVGLCWVGLGWA